VQKPDRRRGLVVVAGGRADPRPPRDQLDTWKRQIPALPLTELQVLALRLLAELYAERGRRHG
jgi:hypothetical protein